MSNEHIGFHFIILFVIIPRGFCLINYTKYILYVVLSIVIGQKMITLVCVLERSNNFKIVNEKPVTYHVFY